RNLGPPRSRPTHQRPLLLAQSRRHRPNLDPRLRPSGDEQVRPVAWRPWIACRRAWPRVESSDESSGQLVRGLSLTCALTSNVRLPRSTLMASTDPGFAVAIRANASCALLSVALSIASNKSPGCNPAS